MYLLILLSSINFFEQISVAHTTEVYKENLEILYTTAGYRIERSESSIPSAGLGVKVTKGTVPKNCIVAMYPGYKN